MSQQYTNAELAQMVVALTANIDRHTTPKIMNAVRNCQTSFAEYYRINGSLKGLDVEGVGLITRRRLENLLEHGFEGVQQRDVLDNNYRRRFEQCSDEPSGGGWWTTRFAKKINYEQDESSYLK
ncbi:MAG: hypothetical protein HY363_05050 [Candidatus Aenigmarchaeota archaeon]|nr:hypothetical protein [Candidatus Aenigmarchaeota archaeon]